MQLLPLIARRLGLLTLPAAPGTGHRPTGDGSLRLQSAAPAASRPGTRRNAPVDTGPESTGWPETQPCLYP